MEGGQCQDVPQVIMLVFSLVKSSIFGVSAVVVCCTCVWPAHVRGTCGVAISRVLAGGSLPQGCRYGRIVVGMIGSQEQAVSVQICTQGRRRVPRLLPSVSNE